jgi:pimeloyl-ACP methyl ester carboxylesterase
MSAILVDGGIVHYEVIGRGRPIIFLHGWSGSWRYWVPAMQSASTSFRAYAMDFWGFGDTAHDKERYAIHRQVNLLENFLSEMGFAKVALVGHGLGGLVGLQFTSRNPGMVDRIMAVSVPMEIAAVNAKLRTAPPMDVADWLLPKNSAAEPVRVDTAKLDPLAVTASFGTPDNFSLASRIGSINNSCLLVYGQNDPAVSLPPYDPSIAPFNMHMIVLEQTGHFPMIDDNARFSRLLVDFLALESGATPRDLQLKEEWKRRVR